MRYHLRTLLILLAVAPPTAAITWLGAPYVVGFIGSLLIRLGGCCSS
jgi:hypothetical protein